MSDDNKPHPLDLKSILKDKPAIILTSIALTAIVLTVITFALLKTAEKTRTYGRILMGTVVEITLREENPVAANEAFSEIERLEAIFSSYIPQTKRCLQDIRFRGNRAFKGRPRGNRSPGGCVKYLGAQPGDLRPNGGRARRALGLLR
jgi:hypothetical protein